MKSIEDAYIKMVLEKTAKATDKTDEGEGMDPVGKGDADIDNDGDSDESDKYLKNRRKAIGKSMKEAASQAVQSMVAKNKQSRSKMDNDEADAASDDWVATNVTGQKPDAKDLPVDKHDHLDRATNDTTKVADKVVAKGGKRPSDNQDGDKFQKITQKEEVEQIDELSSKTLTSYQQKASDSRGHRSLSTKKVDNRYKGVALATKKLDKKEEVEIEEASYKAPTKAEIEADKKKDSKGKPRSSMTAKSANKSVYKNMMSRMEEVESEGYIPGKKPQDRMTSSDKKTMGKVADMMRKEKEKKASMNKEETEIDEAMREAPFKGKPMHGWNIKDRKGKVGIKVADMKKSTVAKAADANPMSANAKAVARRLATQAKMKEEASLRKSISQLSSKFPERSKVKTKDGKPGTVVSSGKDYVKVAHGNQMVDYKPSDLMKEAKEINESHFKMGQKVKCKASGMTGKVVKIDPSEEGKYYTVEKGDGKQMKYAPDELMKEGRTLSDVLSILNK